MFVVGIKFKENGKIYNFKSENILNVGDKVIVDTEKGLQLGEVSLIDKKNSDDKLKFIKAKASNEDYNRYLKNTREAKKALEDTKKLVKNLNLNMSLIDASYSLDKKMLLFNFISDERVDFRNLVKELASKYRARIELHQIGVRDKAKEIGGIGLCGRTLCCHNHLKNVNSVNINMVKNQNIALNPTKINGSCGRLLCCFTYENDLYEKNRKKLPRLGEKIEKNGKIGIVTDLDILNNKYTLKIDENIYEEVSLN